ncbi:hypothetical protein GCM10020254_72310 [Streptomyces goshikiensis]
MLTADISDAVGDTGGSGIQWLAHWDGWFVSLTFARGIAPEELAARLGALPGIRPGPLGASEAWSMAGETVDGDGVARVGRWGGWSFAVEHGMPSGAERLAEVSWGGVEAVHLDPQPDHPPRQFAYARDEGAAVLLRPRRGVLARRPPAGPPAPRAGRGQDPPAGRRLRPPRGRAVGGARPAHPRRTGIPLRAGPAEAPGRGRPAPGLRDLHAVAVAEAAAPTEPPPRARSPRPPFPFAPLGGAFQAGWRAAGRWPGVR